MFLLSYLRTLCNLRLQWLSIFLLEILQFYIYVYLPQLAILVQSVMFRQRSIVLHICAVVPIILGKIVYIFHQFFIFAKKIKFSGCVCRFYSVDLSVYPFVNIMFFLDYFKFTVILKTGQCKSFNFALLFQNCFKAFIPFYFLCLNHRINFFCIYNNSGILLGVLHL